MSVQVALVVLNFDKGFANEETYFFQVSIPGAFLALFPRHIWQQTGLGEDMTGIGGFGDINVGNQAGGKYRPYSWYRS